MAPRQSLLKSIRMTHRYFGVFISPALLFFAFTGFLQTFSLHETTRGSNYKPSRVLMQLGQLHKKQTLVLPERRPAPVTAAPSHDIGSPASAPTVASQPTQPPGKLAPSPPTKTSGR